MAQPDSSSGPSSRRDSVAESNDSCFFEAGPSRAFTSSTIGVSPSNPGTPIRGSPAIRKKFSFRKLSIEAPPILPLNDDCTELTEDKERSAAEQEISTNKSLSKPEEEPDISIVRTMTKEQMEEHVSRCLQLSTENKINTKNAFALKLIDCMTVITKSNDENNFAAMACQLDAGAKIYSSRVDAVHQQVIKLVETCMFAEKKNKKDKNEGEDDSDEDGIATEEKGKDKKKKPKKKVIATNEQISRKPKENNPKEKFIKLEARPGEILNRAKYNPEDLSLTLDRNTSFWIDWSQEPTKAKGECEITEIDTKNRKFGPDLELDHEVDYVTKIEPLLSPKSPVDDETDDRDGETDFENTSQESPEEAEVGSSDQEAKTKDKLSETCIELVSRARIRMTIEGSNAPSTTEVIKTLFHEPGESEYHYLKMDNSNFWAGPSYWKRPHGHNQAENKKKGPRRKREPIEVKYTEADLKKSLKQKQSSEGSYSKRAPNLSKRTMAKWSKERVTYPLDINFDPQQFIMVFHMETVASAVVNDPEKKSEQVPDDESDAKSEDTNDPTDNFISQDMFASSDGSRGSSSPDFLGFPSPGSPPSSVVSSIRFAGFPSPTSGSSPFDPNHGFKGFGSDVSDEQENEESTIPTTSKTGLVGNSSTCDVYEGENLVPMVKTVKVDPIRIVAKPNRVDMQNLKQVMLDIIRRAVEDQENGSKGEGSSKTQSWVAFRDVLSQLFSSEVLHHRTREDLSVQMAFLCLLTLANENNFQIEKDKDDEVIISYNPEETCHTT